MPSPEPLPVFHSPESWIVSLCLGQRQQQSALTVLRKQTVTQSTKRLNYYDCLELRRYEARTPYDVLIEDVRTVCKPLHKPSLVIDITAVRMTIATLFRCAKLTARLVPVQLASGELTPMEDGSWAVPKLDLVSLMGVLTGSRRLDGKKPLLAISADLPLLGELTQELKGFTAKVVVGVGGEGEVWRASAGEDIVLAVALGCLAGERLAVRFSVGC